MKNIIEFKDVISCWPTAADFGRDIGIDDGSARAMKRRNSIASKYWGLVINAAIKRGINKIDYETLAFIASKKKVKKK